MIVTVNSTVIPSVAMPERFLQLDLWIKHASGNRTYRGSLCHGVEFSIGPELKFECEEKKRTHPSAPAARRPVRFCATVE
jgi:hypothetical protein